MQTFSFHKLFLPKKTMTEQELKTAFGKNIKFRREHKKWSQEELSVKTGVTKNTISDFETGTKFARANTLVKLAKALETAPYELLKPGNVLPDNPDDIVAHYSEYVLDAIEEIGKEYLENMKG